MPDGWFYTCTLAEKPVLLFTLVITVFGFGGVRNQDLSTVYFFFSAISSVSSQFPDACSCKPADLFEAVLYGMSVVLIAERGGTQNHSGHGTYDGYFVSKFILLMFLTFTDALNIRFVNRIDLLSRITTL